MSTIRDIPVKGEVVRYRYLWKRDEDNAVRPQEVWPCLILQVAPVGDRHEVLVLPITRDPTHDTRWFKLFPDLRVAGYVVYSEANVDLWPSPHAIHEVSRGGRRLPRPRVSEQMLIAAERAYQSERLEGRALPIDRNVRLNQQLADYHRRRDERARQR
jgi:hypothetical protein